MHEELKPCPYCGETRLLFENAKLEPQAFVTCQRCGMMGPMRMEDVDAITAWNALPRALVWTSEPPTVIGLHLFRFVNDDGIQVGDIVIINIKSLYNECSKNAQWCPIPEPQEPHHE